MTDQTSTQKVGTYILEQALEIAQSTYERQRQDLDDADFNNEPKLSIKNTTYLIKLIGKSLQKDTLNAFAAIEEFGEESGELVQDENEMIISLIVTVPLIREAIWEAIEPVVEKLNMKPRDVIQLPSRIDPLLDQFVYSYGSSYITSNQQLETKYNSTLEELSTPIIPIIQNLAILPLVGNIDTYRATLIMEKTLDQSRKLQLDHMIIDLSGVVTMDTMVAKHLFDITEALSLMGVQVTLTGISPSISISAVQLGIDLHKLTIKSSLHNALTELAVLSNPSD
ncbi:STAS domain-containing protein [Alkalihalobacillus hwajinpoensis]|uniref:STAS domain-containing protein n=1 Tax=Guptibacillus hwajinpoensis TaxID=208199 RepID=UPI001883F7F2|nr:STAS domain-containing protein [Pseudalkalibacillus hwajinpoensis]MBF0708043.1 STAS domain-containing protein [Pseudalkalibacillus hwajinpoensis]